MSDVEGEQKCKNRTMVRVPSLGSGRSAFSSVFGYTTVRYRGLKKTTNGVEFVEIEPGADGLLSVVLLFQPNLTHALRMS